MKALWTSLNISQYLINDYNTVLRRHEQLLFKYKSERKCRLCTLKQIFILAFKHFPCSDHYGLHVHTHYAGRVRANNTE